MRIPTLACTLAMSGYALACAGVAAQDAPKENKGYTTLKTVVIDLGAEIPSMAGWQLRLRMLKIEPGGHIGLHDHKDRPAVVVFQQGTDMVTNGDDTSKTFKAGDTTAEAVLRSRRAVSPNLKVTVATSEASAFAGSINQRRHFGRFRGQNGHLALTAPL